MREVVACKRLKTMEDHKQSGPKSCRDRLQEVVFTKGSNWKALTGEIFGWEVVTHGILTVMY